MIAEMVTGPWLVGSCGMVTGGALGVLMDSVLSASLLRDQAPSRRLVSANISVEMSGTVPADGSTVRARAECVRTGADGGLASGTVTGVDGEIIARCAQHARWAALRSASRSAAVLGSPTLPNPGGLSELLNAGVRASDGGATLKLPVTDTLTNVFGNLHGGVTFCACDLVAQAAMESAGGPVRTESMHVAYPRPILRGSTARFEAEVLFSGLSLGVVRVIASDSSGRPCAVASVTTAS